MGLLEQEIKELREMNKLLLAGKIRPDEVNARIAIYSQTEKRAKMMLQVYSLTAKHGQKTLSMVERSNLIGEKASIDMGSDDEVEVVRCPEKDKMITRGECLDLSGSTGAPEECDGCQHFAVTRRKLLPAKPTECGGR